MDIYCRTCRRALNVLTTSGGRVDYLHTYELRTGEAVDHLPEPVPLSEITDPIIACDFCSEPAEMAYLTQNLKLTKNVVTAEFYSHHDRVQRGPAARPYRTETRPSLENDFGGTWAACAACADLVDANAIPQLVTRVMEHLPSALRTTNRKKMVEQRGQMYQMYEAIIPAITERLLL